VCIIGGGAAGVGLWWTLAQPGQPGADWEVTLIHDGEALGGHALTVSVPYNGKTFAVDTGVQFYIPLLYPNVDQLVKHPGIAERVPVVDYDQLQVACAFPRLDGQPRNWGNFDAYRGGTTFAMYTEAMYGDAQRFQDFIDGALFEGWGSKTVAEYFSSLKIPYEQQDDFLNYFLFPYLSIINGYGASLSDQVTFDDLVPLFAHVPGIWPGLGSFTHPGSGYRRFVNGASSLIQAMADQAQQLKPARLWLNSRVLGVTAAAQLPGPVEVTWGPGQGPVVSDSFDKVVITTDINTAADLLDNEANQTLWSDLYSKYLDKKDWPLLPGKCYIHTDRKVLSPDITQAEESLQFTAYFAGQTKYPYYDMFKTYTTYLQENIHGDPAAAGLYLTMYGYIPDPAKGDTVPDEESVIFEEVWSHGMWLPTFMLAAKRNLHLAQGRGVKLSYPGQLDTGIYIAGNNTTADSLEHAFISGAVMANYAFGAPFPFGFHPAAFGMYELFYKEFMFPAATVSARRARLHEAL
jgi:hypothetical protein